MKGQTEILGIAIVAILVVSIFFLTAQQDSIERPLDERQSFLVALAGSDVACADGTFRVSDLLRSSDYSCLEETLQRYHEITGIRIEAVRDGTSLASAGQACEDAAILNIPDTAELEVRAC